MRPEHQVLDDLASAILDGTPVDWTTAEARLGDEALRGVLRDLKTIAGIADLHTRAELARGEPMSTWGGGGASRLEPRVADSSLSWGTFRLLDRVGEGAHGEVYRAWDTSLDREVALKLLHRGGCPQPHDTSAVLQEGRLLAQVRHPNVVTVYGADRVDGRVGLWMEFIHGRTLEQHLREHGRFSAREAASVGLDLCRAISAVHAAGLLHRDIKAHNVTRSDDGRVVLMDFGTGRAVADESASDLAGTPLYLAPEVLAGGSASVQSDIYSLGVLLFHLVTGSYPLIGQTVRDVRRAHERNDRTGLRAARPELGPALARVIERATDPNPERRYANADALARDLSAAQRRPAVVRIGLAVAVTAALVLVALLASDAIARVRGDRRGDDAGPAGPLSQAPGYLEPPAIAVLPFKNYSGDAGSSLLVDHVTAGLIHQLALIDGLQVRSETSSFMLRNTPMSLADIGQGLNVNLIVEGDAQLSRNTLVINAALVSIRDDRRIWTGRVDRQLSSEADVASVIEDLSRRIVNEFNLKLGRTRRQYRTTDIPTLELYLQARALRDARLFEAPKAIPLFEEVLRRDQSFAPALAALAVSHLSRASTYPNATGTAIPPAEASNAAEPLARRALDLDFTLGEAHAAVGYMHAAAGRWADAEASFRRAISFEPNVTALYGDFVLSTLLPLDRIDDAMDTMEEAVRVSPMSLDARRVLAHVQVAAGLYDEALANCRFVLGQNPDYQFAEEICGLALMFKGETAEALALFSKRANLNEHWIGYIYAITGRRADAEAIADRNHHLPHRPAMIYAALGDKDRAFAALNRLAALNPHRAANYLSLRELASLRSDPRSAILRRKLGLPR